MDKKTGNMRNKRGTKKTGGWGKKRAARSLSHAQRSKKSKGDATLMGLSRASKVESSDHPFIVFIVYDPFLGKDDHVYCL